MQLSGRVRNVRPSGVRKIFDLAAKVKNPINLSIGEPDFDIPDAIKEEGIKWIRAGFNKYTPSGGIPDLREKIFHYLKGKGIICDDVIVTAGATGGLLLSFLVTLDPGDEVITNKTKAILINSPNNPTGAVYSRQELEMVARVAREKNLLIFSDDIYDRFIFEESLQNNYLGQLYENTLTIGGFSKTWAMTGWRLGFVAGPKEIIQSMITNQQYVFSSVNSVAQKAGLFALDYNTDSLIAAYKKKRDLIYDGLKDKYEVVKPKGAYYIFPRVPGDDGDAFVEKTLEKNLFVIPGSVFSRRKSHVRISFASSEENVLKGIEILRSMV
ncbi:MAG: putative N-acetyl-LL-diaminopimelate aminotransferase [Deltaproteobacteria bacterium]|nr:putative N-acetyl-LL-diaminopimelate aminotransferase [Deltaproteobacteria bacterium]